ncbi:MAG: hypothetical protein JKY19_10630 [Alcanivoracaceae bacterium]|nr:hypothetical protein [Alcanivoracaceae bacterium]
MPNINAPISIVDKPLAIFSACCLAAVSAAVFLTLPMLVGAAIRSYQISEDAAGVLVAWYFAGAVVANVSAVYWIRRVNWRNASFVGVGLVALGLIVLPFYIRSYHGAISGLFLAGVGLGVLYGIAVSLLSDTSNKDRNYGFMLIAQQLLGGVLLLVFPQFIPSEASFTFVMTNLGFVLVFISLMAFFMPRQGALVTAMTEVLTDNKSGNITDNKAGNITKHSETNTTAMALLGVFILVIYFVAQAGVWAFVERLADHRGISNEDIGLALAISMIGGLLGGFAVAWQADKFGIGKPIFISTLGFILVFFYYGSDFDLVGFTVASFIFYFFWNYILAYQMSAVANFDIKGNFSVLLPGAMACGAMIGPWLAGIIMQAYSYDYVALIGSTILFVGLGMYGVLLRKNKTTP